MSDRSDFLYNDAVVCPHCGHRHEEHDDPGSLPWTEDANPEFCCSSCGKDFYVQVDLTIRWSTFKDEDEYDTFA